jgi:hypothetical protein
MKVVVCACGPYLPSKGLCQKFKKCRYIFGRLLPLPKSNRNRHGSSNTIDCVRTMENEAVEALADWCLGAGGDNLCCFCVPMPCPLQSSSTNKTTTAVPDPYPTYIHESAWTEHNTPAAAASKQSAFPQRPPWFPKRNE